MLTKTQSIVIQSIPYGDNGHIVKLYTRELGPVSVLIKGAKKASLRNVFMQPLSILDTVLDTKPNRKLMYVKETKPVSLLNQVGFSPIKSAISLFLAEVLSKSLKDEQADTLLFDFIADSIELFNRSEQNEANFHLVFLIKLTRFLGFFPNLSSFNKNVYFDLLNGSFTPSQPPHYYYLTPDETQYFAQIMRMNFDNMAAFRFSRAQRQNILKQIIQYYQLHLPNFGNIKSLEILTELFD